MNMFARGKTATRAMGARYRWVYTYTTQCLHAWLLMLYGDDYDGACIYTSMLVSYKSRLQAGSRAPASSEKMHFYCLTLLTAIVHIATSAQYRCQNSYDPAIYVGNTLVPPTCEFQQLNCPERTGSDWKAGVPQGQSSAYPLIDVNFVQCHEGFLCCGYVPIDSTTGQVLGQSGVTVGSGVDLGSKTSNMLISIGVSSTIVSKLDPYYGLKKNDAACAAIEIPLTLTCNEAQSLTDKVKDDIVTQAQQRYDQEKASDSALFDDLPRGVRTAIVDIWFQFGTPGAYPTFWGYVRSNDWDNAIKELRDFYGSNANPSIGDRRRRNDEADILEAALARCDRSADIVFLLDESGSIGPSDFQSSLNFIRTIIGAFPDETLSEDRGTRFGLSLFDSTYRSIFYLSTYTSKTGYDAVLNTVIQSRGGTMLGEALSLITQDQFVVERGLRPESYGFPKILIVITDGRSHDSVAGPAAGVRGNNTVIYAIGIGGYEREQLEAVASTFNHVKNLSDFSDLSDFSATLTASTCYEPQPVSVGITIVSTIESESFQYYTYNVEVDNNLRVTVMDTRGSTLIYASRETPHPYEYNNDFGFTLASQTSKTIVISPTIRNNKRQASTSNTTIPIYVSIAGASDGETAYTLVGSTCDPALCSEGTNEPDSGTVVPILSLVTMILVSVIAVAIV